MRPDLVPRPDADVTSDLDAHGDLVGRFGAGLFLLFSERFRVCMGYDWRRGPDGLVEHPRSRTLFPARKCIPWMHHAAVPHAILERPGGDCEWLAVLGSFGPRYDWGDGTEANFPQYGLLKVARDRTGRLWDDGECLQLTLRDRSGATDLSTLRWRFRHQPGILRLEPVERGPIESLTALCPPGQRAMRVVVRLREAEPGRVLEVRARVLLRQLTVAPSDWWQPIDVLDAPFGFQKFREHELEPWPDPAGVRWRCAALDTETLLATDPAPEQVALAAADPCAEGFEEAALEPLSVRAPGGPCHDVRLRVPCAAPGPVVVRLALEHAADLRDRAPLSPATAHQDSSGGDASHEDAARDDLEGVGLSLRTGQPAIDGLWRWSRHVAHALCWPNGIVTTGALGYAAKSHVGQDVPFVWPLLALDPHPRLRRAAHTMLERVVDNPRGPRDRGILDHPCEGRDFAFLPMRPTTARLFKRHGAAGLMRWVLCTERALACGLDRDLVRRAFTLFDGLFRDHYVPFSPHRPVWRHGEETQGLAYSVTTAIAALGALQSLAREFGGGDDPVYRRERQRLRRFLGTSTGAGGLRVTHPVRREAQRLDRGWYVAHGQAARHDWRLSFDVPLVSAHALLFGDLPASHRRRLVRLLADPRNPWRVEGAGLAKSQHGQKGVWFWHNSLIARGLMQAGAVDAAWELFTWMGRAMGDVNGLGLPGEEINGGDYAMGIGALAGLCLIEGLLGLRVRGSQVSLAPRLPAALEGFEVRDVWLGDRPRTIRVQREGAGVRIAARRRLLPDEPRLALRI